MSQDSPVAPEARPDGEHHEGWQKGWQEGWQSGLEGAGEQPDHAEDNPFVSGAPAVEEPPAELADTDETTVHPVVDPVDQADQEPTQEFAPVDQADQEPTQEFAPVDQADHEPTQEFAPQPGDPEPTMALPVTDADPETSIRPMGVPAPQEPYQRPPVFTPRGFEPIPEPANPEPGLGAAGPGAAAAFAAPESFEDQDARILQQQAADQERARAVEAENARRREAAELARARSLGTITPEPDDGQPERRLPPRRSTDKWFGSLGIFVLRLVLAAILAIRGYQMITDIPATRLLLSQIGAPWLEYLPWALAIAHGLAALALVFGLGVRVVGVCVTALAGCALALVKWGVVPVFQPGMPGFVGELEVLVAAVGFVLLTLGSGGWGMDAGWRHNRWRDKYGTD